MIGIKIVPLQEKHLQTVVKMIDSQLGPRYITDKEILSWMKDKLHMVKVALNGENIAGFYHVYLMDKDELCRVLRQSLDDLPNQVCNGKLVGNVKTVVVASQSQGTGIGSELMKDAMKWLRTKGAKTQISVAWRKSTGEINIHPLVNKFGFIPFMEIPDYWSEDEMLCPCCGPTTCRCSARMYIK